MPDPRIDNTAEALGRLENLLRLAMQSDSRPLKLPEEDAKWLDGYLVSRGLESDLRAALDHIAALKAENERLRVDNQHWLSEMTNANAELGAAEASLAEAREALRAADEALTQFAAFEEDARYIMGNTNFNIVQERRAQVRAFLQSQGPTS